MDISYEMGLIKAQNAALMKSVDELTQTVSELTKEVEEVKATVTGWKSSAAGAIAVLSVIGAAILWLGDGFIQIVKVKLGM